MKNKKCVTIIGAGVMGHSIAILFARGKWNVNLVDNNQDALDKALSTIDSVLKFLHEHDGMSENPLEVKGRIHPSTSFKENSQKSDLVIEAIVENVEVKRKLLKELASQIDEDTIVASNTSYLNIFDIAPQKLQENIIGAHFFSPPHIIPLVEIVPGPRTRKDIIPTVRKWLEDMEMTVLKLDKFIPGLVINRIQRAIGRETLYLIDEKIVSPEELDKAVKASLGVRLPVLGVVARYDYAGLDMAMNAFNAPSIGLINEDKISTTIQNLVKAGHLGVKTGKGIFDYSDKPMSETLKERDIKLIEIKKMLKSLGEI